jgi:hypothetical protein
MERAGGLISTFRLKAAFPLVEKPNSAMTVNNPAKRNLVLIGVTTFLRILLFKIWV